MLQELNGRVNERDEQMEEDDPDAMEIDEL